MSMLTDFIVNYGDVVRLRFYSWDCNKITSILNAHPGWKIYQPHKPGYNRFGLSVTSLNGGYSGEPDLYSLREYNAMHNTNYTEADFTARTSIVDMIPNLNEFLDFWGEGLGRTHFLRLDKGGFFPPHRDNGAIISVPSFRILIPIHNFGENDMKWIHEDKMLNLTVGETYFINTTKQHSLFSFVDNCLMLVLNVYHSPAILNRMVHHVIPI
jgi:hypothetical protein